MDSDTNLNNVFIGTPEALGLTHLPSLEEEQNEVIDDYLTSEEDDGDFPLVEADSDSSGGEEIDIKNRTRIRPFGDSFRKSNEVLPEAYSIIKGLFTEAWISWRKVPKQRKDLWFEEFKMNFFWKDKHANAVRKNWRGKCSTFLRTTFCEARAMANG